MMLLPRYRFLPHNTLSFMVTVLLMLPIFRRQSSLFGGFSFPCSKYCRRFWPLWKIKNFLAFPTPSLPFFQFTILSFLFSQGGSLSILSASDGEFTFPVSVTNTLYQGFLSNAAHNSGNRNCCAVKSNNNSLTIYSGEEARCLFWVSRIGV